MTATPSFQPPETEGVALDRVRRRALGAAGAALMAASFFGFAGQVAGLQSFPVFRAGGAPVAPGSAVCLCIAGFGLVALGFKHSSLTRASGLMLMVMGGAVFAIETVGHSLGISWLSYDNSARAVGAFPGYRMAPLAAVSFLVFGCLLIVATARLMRAKTLMALSTILFLAASMTFLGYLAGIRAALQGWVYTGMSLPVAFAFLIASIAVARWVFESMTASERPNALVLPLSIATLSTLIGVTVISLINNAELIENARLSATSLKVTTYLDEVGLATARAELCVRGYAITGNPEFLGILARRRAEAEQGIAGLIQVVGAKPGQTARAIRLRTLEEEALDYYASLAKIRDTRGAEAAFEAISEEPRSNLAALRRLMADLGSEEQRIASRQEEATQQLEQGTRRIQWVGGIVAIGLMTTALFQLRRASLERARALGKLEKAVGDLERSNRELEQFAYVASHDLQEPLRAVSGCVQILAQDHSSKLDKDAHALIRHAVEGSERMKNLIEDLLTLSRVGAPGKPLVATDSAESCKAALGGLEVAIRESGVSIAVEELPLVLADKTQLELLFQNLLSNAIKYRRAGRPQVSVTAVSVGQDWQFSVADNGIGIDPRYFERIFGVFQRLHARSEYPGTGIGLAIAKKIVERHGGKIWVESLPGSGSRFHFTLQGVWRSQPK